MNASKGKVRVRRMEKKWLLDESLMMVNIIRENEAIWNPSSPLFKNRDLKIKNWAEIAQSTDHSISDAKNHWNTIKSRFNAEQKKMAQDQDYHSKYELYEPLTFLRLNDATPLNSTAKKMKHENTSTPQSIKNEPNVKKRKLIATCTPTKNRPDRSAHLTQNAEHDVVCNESSNRQTLEEIAAKDKWKRVFSEYIFYELDKYDFSDAQALKNKLTKACLEFEPRNDFILQ